MAGPDLTPEELAGWSAFHNGIRAEMKWGKDVIAFGFAIMPNLLLRINRHVPQEKRLKSGELCLLMILVSYWWEHNQFPFPGIKTLAADAGLSERQTKRWLLSLRTKGYIYVVRAPARNGRLRNQYDLRGAAATLAVVAERQIALKKQIATDRDLIAETADK